MKKILIISTSLRVNSNSELLAKRVMEGALANGNEVELVSLRDKNIAFCKGCLACQRLGKCIINDDANAITDKIAEADVIIWATPIYYYEMSGQMKTMIDRANSLYSRERKFKEVYLLATAAEDEDYVPNRAIEGLKGWVDCFDEVEFKGCYFVGDVNDPKDILQSKKYEKAYDFGRKI